jgi:hypothetical protein
MEECSPRYLTLTYFSDENFVLSRTIKDYGELVHLAFKLVILLECFFIGLNDYKTMLDLTLRFRIVDKGFVVGFEKFEDVIFSKN